MLGIFLAIFLLLHQKDFFFYGEPSEIRSKKYFLKINVAYILKLQIINETFIL